ncbi:MAG: helix-turn-helix domain-containing protein [Proteobacteria bacterium]|nr:helix-turn-helix domain-containing protein [Pseudomonadota bacterium]
MKIEFEEQDIQFIAVRVVELIRPLLTANPARQSEDIIFDVPGLCEYLKVSKKWIHERTHLKQIPHFKGSNKMLRFRKRDVDKWLESLKTPAINDFTGRLKAIK